MKVFNCPFLISCAAPVMAVVAWSGIAAMADEKPQALQASNGSHADAGRTLFKRPDGTGKSAHRIMAGSGAVQYPVVVVRGTPYEMGRQLGECIKKEMNQFVPAAMAVRPRSSCCRKHRPESAFQCLRF